MHIIVLVVISFSQLLSPTAGSQRIIGGTKVPPGSARFHASLQNLTGHHVCGSAAISSRHLVTAAHCVLGARPGFIKVVVGTTNLDKGGLEYNVTSIYIHEHYNFTLKLNDIAVLKINGWFNMKKVQILPLEDKELMEDDIVLLTGFGAKEPHGESSRRMYALTLKVFSQETCQFAFRHTREVFNSMFCTFKTISQGGCHGDSGGPLIRNNKLVGLVSWGIPCAVGFPDVHTRISSYVKWINRVMNRKKCRQISFETAINVKITKYK